MTSREHSSCYENKAVLTASLGGYFDWAGDGDEPLRSRSIAVWCGECIRLPAQNCIAWVNQQPKYCAKFDLQTGKVSVDLLSKIAVMLDNSHGQRIRTWAGIELLDAISGQPLWHDYSLHGYQRLVGDRYLVKQKHDQVSVIDMLPVFEHPSPDTRAPAPNQITVHGLEDSDAWYKPEVLQAIDGTNRFLCTSLKGTSTITVYEIDNGQVTSIAAWPFGGGAVIQADGKIYSAAAQKRELEVRSSQTLEVIDRLPFPVELRFWPDVSHRQGLISFNDASKGLDVVCRLSDLQRIPELTLPLVLYQENDDPRYHLLADGLLFDTNRLVVYDSERNRIALDTNPPHGLITLCVWQGKLVTVTAAMGLTVEEIDLASGQLVKRHQPFLWSFLVVPLLWLAAMVWLVAWCYQSLKLAMRPWISITTVVILFCVPLVYRLITVDYTATWRRPAVDLLLAVLFSLAFGLALFVVYGRQRVLLRISALLMAMAVWLVAARTLAGPTIFVFSVFSLQGVTRVLLPYVVISTFALACFRMIRVHRYFLHDKPDDTLTDKIPVTLLDIFILTTSSALLLIAAGPYRQIALFGQLPLVNAAGLCLATLPGLLGLVRSVRFYRLLAMVFVAMGCLTIFASTLQMAMGHFGRDLVYSISGGVLRCSYGLLSTFVLCTLMRSHSAPFTGQKI